VKFILDENFGLRLARLLTSEGHDVQIVYQQEIAGCTDTDLFDVCRDEGRCLFTFDLDFSDVTRFPPSESAGIVVFRIPKDSTIYPHKQVKGDISRTPLIM